MSSDKETTDYIELRPGDRVQVGDQWLDQFGQWHFYTHSGNTGGFVNSGVKARRPIRTTHQTTYEEVPGSRTAQETIINPQRERIAYEELRPGDVIQKGDEHRNADGRWHAYDLSLCGSRVHGAWDGRARRPYKISAILEIGDALANAQKAATQLQDERDELKAALRESHAAHEFTMKQGLAAIAERNEAERLLAEARMERDKARSDQKSIQAYRDTALQELGNAEQALSEERAAHVQARNDRDRLQEVVGNLYNEPTARQVQDMLRTWATELDWSADCFHSVNRDEIDTIQRTLIAVMERIETMLNPEGGTDDN